MFKKIGDFYVLSWPKIFLIYGGLLTCIALTPALAQQDSTAIDSTEDTLPVEEYERSRRPTYDPKDRPGNSIIYPDASSPFILKNPGSFQLDVEVDTSLNYSIGEKLGSINYRPPTNLNFEQYNRLHAKKPSYDIFQSAAEHNHHLHH